jgi:uncharacterized protein YwgA
MDERLIALNLFLEALDVPPDITTVTKRKRVQKTVYLGQRAGVNLGYMYGWYLMGPYSTSLTRDYYTLADELESSNKTEVRKRRLQPEIEKRLKNVRSLLQPPKDVKLDQDDWIELVASYDYLRTVSGYSHEKAVAMLRQTKNHLVGYVDAAVGALRAHSLLN